VSFLASYGKHLVLLLWRMGIVWPLPWLLSKVVEPVPRPPDAPPPGPDAITLLALNPDRFRGDLEILARSPSFRVLRLPYRWQCRVAYLFYTNEVPFDHYYNSDLDPIFARKQARLRTYLRVLLPKFYRRVGVDAAIGAAVHYVQDFEIGTISNEVGFPYIVLHRENLVTNERHRQRYVDMGRRMAPFRGAHVVVHNEEVRSCYIESGFVPPEQISALGCLRMDDYLQRISLGPQPRTLKRKRVVLFSFHHGTGLLGVTKTFSADRSAGFVELFDSVHAAFAEFAQARPDVDFLIKPKWGGSWYDYIDEALALRKLEKSSIPNLAISADVDAQEAILEADVVCGFGSTTLLEAAVADKPVVVPLYHEAADARYREYLHYLPQLHLFDVGRSEEEFISLLEKRLAEPEIEPSLRAERLAAFERFVSPLGGTSLQRYTEKIAAVTSKSTDGTSARAASTLGILGRT